MMNKFLHPYLQMMNNNKRLRQSLSAGFLIGVLTITILAGTRTLQSSHAAAACITTPDAPTNLAQGLSSTSGYTTGNYSAGGYGGGILTNLPNSMMLVWSAVTPATGCSLAGYHIYRNGALVASATTTTYTDTGLSPSTTYTYAVTAYDTDSNQSAKSTAFTGTTASDGAVIIGDINGDGRVNAIDLSALISHDGQNYPLADLNHDGTVGAADLAILLAKWTW